MIIFKTAILVSLIALTGCVRPDKSTAVLKQANYTNIQMQGYAWFACSKDDWYSEEFTAISPSGQQVQGVVCGGLLFKGNTIRIY